MADLLNRGVIGAAQLHGQEDETYISRLRNRIKADAPLIQAFSIRTKEDVLRAVKSSADLILLDQGSGGSGRTFDWSLADAVDRPFFLAGGLAKRESCTGNQSGKTVGCGFKQRT